MPQESLGALSVLDEAGRMLESVKSLEEVKSIRDRAEAARTFAKAARLGLQTQNRAAIIKLRAERKAGNFLQKLKLRGGDRKSTSKPKSVRLADLGISQNESKRWQLEASVSDEEFEKYVSESNRRGTEVTAAGLIRLAKTNRNNPSRDNSAITRNAHTTLSDPEQLIAEIECHRSLLADLIRPLYTNGEIQLRTGERRAVGYLLSEIARLLRQLKKGVS